MTHPILKATFELGQSIWLDYISRELLNSGKLDTLINEGLRGMTSNPTIFEQAIRSGRDYDGDIQQGMANRWSPKETYEHLAVTDIQRAADALRRVYDEADGADGFVSLEVSPKLAHDTDGTIAEARRLWQWVDRPNLMIKVPGTSEGIPAILALLQEGVNVNVTLLFSLKQYREVLDTYLQALEGRAKQGQEIRRIASVASFFVSRVDTSADKQLIERGRSDLAGKAAIANACLAYQHFQAVTARARWKTLSAKGARVQRPLWASTSTKNPAYLDVIYVQELLAENTVNTLPPQTLDAWKDHGRPERSLARNMPPAESVVAAIRAAGVNLDQITEDLIEDGVKKFADSFDTLLAAIAGRLAARGRRL